MIKFCKLCGKEFETNKNAAKYCGESCSIKAHRKKVYEYRERKLQDDQQKAKAEGLLYRQNEEAKRQKWIEVLNSWKADRIAEGHTDFFMPYEWKQLQAEFNIAWNQGKYSSDGESKSNGKK